ncbi:MAG: GNAT family N-acetyltransferase [Caulobacteraceae bacterium]|nr:MAG: GNAT family N-acetyltransferase [Caulobacteraceae bacterium]
METLERIADRAWPAAERSSLGPWILNASAGWSGRLNACWPLGAPPLPLAEAVDAVEAWYAARRLPAMFKPAGPLPALEAELTARGYRARTPTLMMAADIPDVARPERVAVADTVGAAFEQVFLGTQDNADDAAERMGAFHRVGRPRVFASIEVDGAPVAIGGSAVEGDWAGVFGMRTLAGWRRQGLARDIVAALMAGAKAAGATKAYLQVEAPNAPAIALYERFGFRTAFGYSYWDQT